MQAASAGNILPLYVDEPQLWEQPDAGARHRRFISDALYSLREELTAIGLNLCIAFGPVETILAACLESLGTFTLWSHEETGNGWSFARDKRVGSWCHEHGVRWLEIPQNGVIRRMVTRNGWAHHWERRMAEPLSDILCIAESVSPDVRENAVLRNGFAEAAVDRFRDRAVIWTEPPTHGAAERLEIQAQSAQRRTQQVGSRRAALQLLSSFLTARGRPYRYALSSPVTAAKACSRLSPHIAFGTISLREVVQQTDQRLHNLEDGDPMTPEWRKSLRSFRSRLHWHCHFMQKLESEPALEFANIHPAYNGLREDAFHEAYFTAWKLGCTGIPFVDACMRSLRFSGWSTFRMRAMLCSFASFQLWLHWRRPALYLAKLFTDYEPGIHFSQMQMQSGTTGVNTIRMYNPVKQGIDYDAAGTFIRQWCPELALLPVAYLHEPWKVDATELARFGVILEKTYPAPVVDHVKSARTARDAAWAVRRNKRFRDLADEIQDKHGSRKSGLPEIRRRGRIKPDAAATSPHAQNLPLFEE